jgi:hypothetical protein
VDQHDHGLAEPRAVSRRRDNGGLANWAVPFTNVVWEPGDADRKGTQFRNTGLNPTNTTNVNLLDIGDMYLERISLVDLNLQKNIRF